MATSSHHYIALARTLPPRLLNFFSRHPPTTPITLTRTTSILPQSSPTTRTHSPFSRNRNPFSGKIHPPAYSLRRQADLTKLAHTYKVPDLLPPSIKDPKVRERKRIEQGLRVKGTGVGQAVKGKKRERTLKGRLERRRQAMLGMPELVRQWKQMGHGRGWKKWPK